MPPSRRDLFDWLDEQAEEFSAATTREYYLNYAGHKDKLELAPIFERHADLFQKKTVTKALRAGDDDPRAPNLRAFVVEGYLEQAAKELTEEIAGRETSDTVEWDGEPLPYRSVQQRLLNEPDHARRRQLERLRLEVTAAQNPLREHRWDLLYGQAGELGFASYRALCDETGSLKLAGLRDMLERFLWETVKPYRDRLERELRDMEVDPAAAERSDLLRLFRSPQFDGSFPRERMLPALEATLQKLGVDTANQSSVKLDTEERPKKSPRAFCAPVAIPGEIYLVISPHGGHDDYRALFHEAGHAQHFAHIEAGQPFAYRGLGDNSVTEGFAFVLESPLSSAGWLRRELGIEESAAYLSLTRFHKLYMLRRYAAKLLYEFDLHGGDDVRSHGKHYADLLTTHLGVRHSPVDYLADLDDGFYCARYLRAWIFDAQLRARFAQRWGQEWFAEAEAGDALRELWAKGQRHPAEELLRQLGEPGLSMDPLAAELAQL
ncbi:MAG: hypothetical protein IH958_04345 [Chloroflexi bacterium]|nr:hypothetical protein [Chloroflexota bacterium]